MSRPPKPPKVVVGDVIRIPHGSFVRNDDWRKGYEGKCAVVVYRNDWGRARVHPLVAMLKRAVDVPADVTRSKPVPVEELNDEEVAALMLWQLGQ